MRIFISDDIDSATARAATVRTTCSAHHSNVIMISGSSVLTVCRHHDTGNFNFAVVFLFLIIVCNLSLKLQSFPVMTTIIQ